MSPNGASRQSSFPFFFLLFFVQGRVSISRNEITGKSTEKLLTSRARVCVVVRAINFRLFFFSFYLRLEPSIIGERAGAHPPPEIDVVVGAPWRSFLPRAAAAGALKENRSSPISATPPIPSHPFSSIDPGVFTVLRAYFFYFFFLQMLCCFKRKLSLKLSQNFQEVWKKKRNKLAKLTIDRNNKRRSEKKQFTKIVPSAVILRDTQTFYDALTPRARHASPSRPEQGFMQQLRKPRDNCRLIGLTASRERNRSIGEEREREAYEF